MSTSGTLAAVRASWTDDARAPGPRLLPFRGLRYAEPTAGRLRLGMEVGGDSPRHSTTEALKAGDENSVLHLAWPARPEEVPETLRRWVADGVLVRDEQPAFYVYEYDVGGRVVRGILGAVAVDESAATGVIPHEGILPDAVDSFRRRFAATRVDVEPVLLVQRMAYALRERMQRHTTENPVLDLHHDRRERHRLWRIDQPDEVERVACDLAERTVLIADGHHRFSSRVPADTKCVLSMVIDAHDHPLHLEAIHRIIPNLAFDALMARLTHNSWVGPWEVVTCSPGLAQALLAGCPDHTFMLGDGRRWLVGGPMTASLDVMGIHQRLLPALDVADSQLLYRHHWHVAVQTAEETGGMALMLKSPNIDDVLAVAGEGDILPQKATSFGPKPSMAVVLHDF